MRLNISERPGHHAVPLLPTALCLSAALATASPEFQSPCLQDGGQKPPLPHLVGPGKDRHRQSVITSSPPMSANCSGVSLPWCFHFYFSESSPEAVFIDVREEEGGRERDIDMRGEQGSVASGTHPQPGIEPATSWLVDNTLIH